MPDLVHLEITPAPERATSHARPGILFSLIFQVISFGLLVGGLIGSSSKSGLCHFLSFFCKTSLIVSLRSIVQYCCASCLGTFKTVCTKSGLMTYSVGSDTDGKILN
jgi:hypothetical protein